MFCFVFLPLSLVSDADDFAPHSNLYFRRRFTHLHVVQQHAGGHHAQPSQQVRGQHLEEDHPGALSGGNTELCLLHLVRTPAEAEVHLRSSKLSLLMCAEALPIREDQPLFVFLSVSLPSPLNTHTQTHTESTNVAVINIYLIADDHSGQI